jgi:hypothetical protein
MGYPYKPDTPGIEPDRVFDLNDAKLLVSALFPYSPDPAIPGEI